jgi:hypothetical protein
MARRRINDGLNKWQRRRKKLQEERRCEHCGKPCAPFSACPERLAYNNQRRKVKEFNLKRGVSYNLTPLDVRRLPRVEYRPVVTEEMKAWMEWQQARKALLQVRKRLRGK